MFDQQLEKTRYKNKENENLVRENKTVQEFQKKQKRKKIIIRYSLLLFLILTAIGTGGYFYAIKQTNPSVVIDNFRQAVEDNDVSQLVKLINQGNPKLDANKEMVRAYIDFLKENKQEYYKALADLKIPSNSVTLDDKANKWFSLEQNSKMWGYFDKYKLVVQPYYLEVTSTFDHTKFYLNDDLQGELDDNKKLRIGPILPGDYTLTAQYEGEFSTLKKDQKLKFSEAVENVLEVGVPLEGFYVNIITNSNALIYINGTKSSIDPTNALNIGPFSTDNSIEVYAEMETEGGLVKSNTSEITRAEDIYLNFDFSKTELVSTESSTETYNSETETEEGTEEPNNLESAYMDEYELSSFMNNLAQQNVIAINTNDFSQVSSFIHENAPGYKETRDYIDYAYKKGITEEFLGLTVLNYKQLDELTWEVTTEEEYNIYFGDGTEKYKKFISRYSIRNDNTGLLVNRLLNTEEVE
jgi:membrane-associated protein TcaA